jgi:hypothetical protein
MLSAHLDVVPALEGWEHPPFAAEVHDGYVWGRGAVDMKHMAAMRLVVFLELRRAGNEAGAGAAREKKRRENRQRTQESHQEHGIKPPVRSPLRARELLGTTRIPSRITSR